MRLLAALLVVFPAVTAADVKEQLSDDGPMTAHFHPDATVFLPNSATTGLLPPDKLDWFTHHQDASFDPFEVGKPTTGTRGDVRWTTVDVKQPWAIIGDCPPALKRCHRARTLRLSELTVAGKVVAMHVDDPVRGKAEATEVDPLAATSDAGPLTKLLIDPAAIAKTLHDDPSIVVLGTEVSERAVGPAAAKKLLGAWSKLTLAIEGKPREVRSAAWGIAAANVTWTVKGKVTKLRATLYALQIDGAWKVVGVHYSLPFRRVMYN